MVIRAVVLDEFALPILESAILEPTWFKDFDWPGHVHTIRRVPVKEVVYLLSRRADENSRYIVINTEIFDKAASPQHAFDRLIRVALSMFERTTVIPVTWRSYNSGSRYSIYAQPETIGKEQRMYFQKSPRDTHNLFVYAITEKVEDFYDVNESLGLYDKAISTLVDALLDERAIEPNTSGGYGIVLAAPLGSEYIGSATLDEWFERKLTREQRNFVKRSYDRPVRLKGPAGSGKTLSMAVKCLRDLYAAEDAGKDLSFAFLTHSSAVAEETLPGMFSALDPKWRWRSLATASLTVGSLYELAQAFLQYDQKALKPLSIDGRDGREFQFLLIRDVIESMLKSSIFINRDIKNLSDDFREALKNSPSGNRFILELMNEFACVIDAEGIRLGTNSGDSYLIAAREPWQMDLPCIDDREAVLRIHDGYRNELDKSGVLSLDQMIADFNRYLELHEWNQLRDRKGFDAIFVDELHYFNRAERMVFHNLFKKRAKEGGRTPIFMSYDLKQSPADSFLGYRTGETASNFFQRIGAGSTELVELTRVFRSTPQITEFLRDLDASFPALDLEEEWSNYTGHSDGDAGERPELLEFATNTNLVDKVFARARRDAAEFGGKKVAVLCLNDELFDRYRVAGRIHGQQVTITSRDQLAELKYVGNRCVLSMPEYVAGLQFDSVYLIHVDKAELADASVGQRRRFISRCYLGASRAAKKLTLAVSRERGGSSEVLSIPLERASLVKVDHPN